LQYIITYAIIRPDFLLGKSSYFQSYSGKEKAKMSINNQTIRLRNEKIKQMKDEAEEDFRNAVSEASRRMQSVIRWRPEDLKIVSLNRYEDIPIFEISTYIIHLAVDAEGNLYTEPNYSHMALVEGQYTWLPVSSYRVEIFRFKKGHGTGDLTTWITFYTKAKSFKKRKEKVASESDLEELLERINEG
jgi:hypothetical protein